MKQPVHPRCKEAREIRAYQIDRSVSHSGRDKHARVDLGLALLEIVAKPGVGLTQHDIALWCGCSTGGIYMLERRALRKLSNRVRFGRAHEVWRELTA